VLKKFIFVKNTPPSFPHICPYCGKRNSTRTRKIQQIVTPENSGQPTLETILVPTCDDCWAKNGLYGFLSLISTILFFFILVAKVWWAPVQNIAITDFLTILGVGAFLTAAFNRLRTEHLNQCHLQDHDDVGLLFKSKNKTFADSLALLNRAVVEEKRK